MTHLLEIRNDVDARELELAWSDGSAARLSHRVLRARCRCAECRQAACEGTVLQMEGVVLVGIEPYGPNAVHLKFSDGHERGIFPFEYLREVAQETASRRSATQATAGRWRASKQFR